MTDRKERLIAFEKEIMVDKLEQTLECLDKEYQSKKKEADSYFINQMVHLFEKTCHMQSGGLKKAVSYLCISPLRCGAVAGEDDLLIALYDKDWYLDRNPIYGYWKPAILFRCINEDMQFFESKARKQFVRLEEFEVLQVKLDYLNNFYVLLQCFCTNMVDEICSCPPFLKMETTADFSILFGEYMGGMTQLYPLKEIDQC